MAGADTAGDAGDAVGAGVRALPRLMARVQLASALPKALLRVSPPDQRSVDPAARLQGKAVGWLGCDEGVADGDADGLGSLHLSFDGAAAVASPAIPLTKTSSPSDVAPAPLSHDCDCPIDWIGACTESTSLPVGSRVKIAGRTDDWSPKVAVTAKRRKTAPPTEYALAPARSAVQAIRPEPVWQDVAVGTDQWYWPLPEPVATRPVGDDEGEVAGDVPVGDT